MAQEAAVYIPQIYVVCRTASRGLHPQLLDSSDWDSDVWLTSNIWREVSQPLPLSLFLSHPSSSLPPVLPLATYTHVERASLVPGQVGLGLQVSLVPASTSSSVSATSGGCGCVLTWRCLSPAACVAAETVESGEEDDITKKLKGMNK